MKTTITAILAIAGATTVAAADFPANVPDCGVSKHFTPALVLTVCTHGAYNDGY